MRRLRCWLLQRRSGGKCMHRLPGWRLLPNGRCRFGQCVGGMVSTSHAHSNQFRLTLQPPLPTLLSSFCAFALCVRARVCCAPFTARRGPTTRQGAHRAVRHASHVLRGRPALYLAARARMYAKTAFLGAMHPPKGPTSAPCATRASSKMSTVRRLARLALKAATARRVRPSQRPVPQVPRPIPPTSHPNRSASTSRKAFGLPSAVSCHSPAHRAASSAQAAQTTT